MSFTVMTLKGNVVVYKVKSGGEFGSSMLDACTHSWQASILDVLRQRSLSPNILSDGTVKPVSVKYLRLLGETSVLVFLSDSSVMEYDSRAKLWRQTLLKDSVMEQLKSQGSLSDAAMDGHR